MTKLKTRFWIVEFQILWGYPSIGVQKAFGYRGLENTGGAPGRDTDSGVSGAQVGIRARRRNKIRQDAERGKKRL